jgi:hypothetical protein
MRSLNCVTSALSFGPGLFRKGFACSTRISSASGPSTLMVSSIRKVSDVVTQAKFEIASLLKTVLKELANEGLSFRPSRRGNKRLV